MPGREWWVLAVRRWLPAIGVSLGAGLLVVVVLAPFYWIVLSSLTGRSELFSIPPDYMPAFTFENYVNLARQIPFFGYLRNSLLFAAGTTLVTVAVSFLAAYGFARYSFRGANLLLFALVMSMALPEIITVVPLFETLRSFRLLNTVTGLVIVMSSVLVPFTVWVLVSFVKQVPVEMEEAAVLDGATLPQVLWWIVVPVMKPAIATMVAINFINAWNNLIYPLVFSSSVHSKTLSVAITEVFQARSPYGRPWELISALGVTMVVPVVVLVFVAQRSIMAGLTSGSIK